MQKFKKLKKIFIKLIPQFHRKSNFYIFQLNNICLFADLIKVMYFPYF